MRIGCYPMKSVEGIGLWTVKGSVCSKQMVVQWVIWRQKCLWLFLREKFKPCLPSHIRTPVLALHEVGIIFIISKIVKKQTPPVPTLENLEQKGFYVLLNEQSLRLKHAKSLGLERVQSQGASPSWCTYTLPLFCSPCQHCSLRISPTNKHCKAWHKSRAALVRLDFLIVCLEWKQAV